MCWKKIQRFQQTTPSSFILGLTCDAYFQIWLSNFVLVLLGIVRLSKMLSFKVIISKKHLPKVPIFSRKQDKFWPCWRWDWLKWHIHENYAGSPAVYVFWGLLEPKQKSFQEKHNFYCWMLDRRPKEERRHSLGKNLFWDQIITTEDFAFDMDSPSDSMLGTQALRVPENTYS